MSTGSILLVGGGTGGHVFPMIAVADALCELNSEINLVFVGTSNGLEARVVPARGYPLELIEALPLRGGGLRGALRGGFRAMAGLGQARQLIRKHNPAVVFSLGGYVAGAICVAARLGGVPLALMEPNSVAGFANRLIAPFAQRAYVAFAETERHFSKKIVFHSGVALRTGFEPGSYKVPAGALKLLILGGSLGARALNESLPSAISRITSAIEVVHQAGKGNGAQVAEQYRQLCPHLKVSVVEFIEEMPQALTACDLVISRAGASAVSEICAVGRPSLLIPYPFAADNHQFHNAKALELAGAALCIDAKDASVERLAMTLQELTSAPLRLAAMAEAARQWGRPHAAEVVARDLLQLAGFASHTQPNFAAPGAGTEGVLRRTRQETARAY